MALTVIGVFDNASEAQQAVEALVSDGFSRSSIDLSATQTDSSTSTGGDYVQDRNRNTSGTYAEEVADDTKDVGSGIGNFFSSLFGGGDDADRYSRVGDRSSIVTVHAQSEDEAERAADILDDNGAVDVNERDAQYGSMATETGVAGTSAMGYTGTTMGTTDRTDLTDMTDRDMNTGDTIKVVEENLQVGKREVETGGVRVRSRIVERPVEESLRLREERVTVTRNPVNRPATEADLNAFQEGQIEMRETAERAVVSKTANVVEEISIGKEVTEHDEVIRDTVRKTEVDVENLGTTEGTVRTERTGFDTDDTTYSTK
ncbi:YsnF/AvaK domain-containing protein [Spirosoma arcticum]